MTLDEKQFEWLQMAIDFGSANQSEAISEMLIPIKLNLNVLIFFVI